MQKISLVVLMFLLVACTLRAKHHEINPTPTNQLILPATTTSSTNVFATVTANFSSPTPAVIANADTIPPSFFAMNTVDENDYPKLTFGTLSHPAIGTWAWIERTKGQYDFSMFDKDISAAVAHGLVNKATNTASVAITLGETPPWAAADPKSCKTTSGLTWCTSGPANIQDWKDFVQALLNHYNGVAMPHVRYYELWNEMNINLFWTGKQSDMLELAQAAYPIIHADPHSMMLTPSVVGSLGSLAKGTGAALMVSYLDAGGSKYADGGAFHGYRMANNTPYAEPEDDTTPGCENSNGCHDSIVAKANLMRQVFNQHGLSGKPMFDTEGSWGYLTVTDADADTQTAWLARWYLLQAGMYATDNLQMAAWFTWGHPTTFHWGTIETAAGGPTPAGIAFNQVYTWLVGAKMNQPCSSTSDGTWTCALTRPGGYNALAIWNTQGPKSYIPTITYVTYRDLAGNTVKLTKGASVMIGIKPILLESSLDAPQ